MNDPAPLRTALIGYGYAGRTFHAPLLRSLPGFDLALIVSRQEERAVQETAGEVRVVADATAAFAAGGIDLVVIEAPNAAHAQLAEAALAAGCHVVVDKPFTVTLAEARRVAAAAARAGKLLSVFQNRRWDSDFRTIAGVLGSGRLGRLVQFESRIDRFRPEVRDRWREKPGPGTGLWFDLGPHLIDQALLLFGLPASITLHTACQRQPGTAPDWFHAVLTYPDLHAILSAGCLVAGGSARFVLHGTGASLVKRGIDIQESQLRAGMSPGDLDWGIDLEAATLIDGDSAEPELIAAEDGDYRLYYEALREAILGVAPNPVPPAQALAVMAALEAGAESAACGQSLPLALTEAERLSFEAARPAFPSS
ncbi:oxidoreductase [Acidisoma sp. C75]